MGPMRKVLSGRPTRRRGFTIIELLVAMTLSTLFMIVVLVGWDQTNYSMRDTISRGNAQSQARAGTDDMSRWLRGATPLGACIDSGRAVTNVSVTNCLNTGEAGAAIAKYQQDDSGNVTFAFYAYTRAGAARSESGCLRPDGNRDATPAGLPCPPDYVQVVSSNNPNGGIELTLQRYAPRTYATGTNYTNIASKDGPSGSNPGWESEPFAFKSIGTIISGSASPFSFYDADGSPVVPSRNPDLQPGLIDYCANGTLDSGSGIVIQPVHLSCSGPASASVNPNDQRFQTNQVAVVALNPTYSWERSGPSGGTRTFQNQVIVALPGTTYSRESTL